MTEQELQILKEFNTLEVNSKFMSNNFREIRKKYGGAFVAILGGKIIASAVSFQEIMETLKDNKINLLEVIIQFVPKEGEIILY